MPDIVRILNASQDLEPLAVAFQVLLMTLTSLFMITIFNVLRPRYKTIYEPTVKYHFPGRQPPPCSNAHLGWIPPLIHTKEQQIVAVAGLDAAIFLRLLRMLRWLFTLICVVSCGLLIPLDMYASRSTILTILNSPLIPPASNSTTPNLFTTMTIRHVPPTYLYAHIGASYLICFLLILYLLSNWHAVSRLRHAWFCSPEFQRAFYARTLYITNVPSRKRSDRGLLRIMNGFKPPYPVTSAYMARQVGNLPKLIDEHNETVIKFEKIIVQYLKGNKLGSTRPVIRVGGWCGFGGRKYDAIEYYIHKLKQTEGAVQQYRAQVEIFPAESFGFASLSSIQSAHEAAQELQGKHLAGNVATGMRMKLAPHPQDIMWENVSLTPSQILFRRISGHFILLFFCFTSILPAVITAILANIDAITKTNTLPFLTRFSQSSPTLYSFLSGLFPPLIAFAFARALPPLMVRISSYMGPRSFSQRDRLVVARYYAFLVVSQIILFMALGVVVNTVLNIIIHVQQEGNFQSVIDDLNELPRSIAATYVDQSSFWLKWFPLRILLSLVDMAKLGHLTWIWFKTKFYGRTPRSIRDWTKPKPFDYAFHYSNFLFMATVGLVFAPVAPLVTVAACVTFWMGSWIFKYQLLFVFVTRIESGGRLWNTVINRLIFAGVFMHIVLLLTVGFQFRFNSVQFLLSVPPLFALGGFKLFLNRRFGDFPYCNAHSQLPPSGSSTGSGAGGGDGDGDVGDLGLRHGQHHGGHGYSRGKLRRPRGGPLKQDPGWRALGLGGGGGAVGHGDYTARHTRKAVDGTSDVHTTGGDHGLATHALASTNHARDRRRIEQEAERDTEKPLPSLPTSHHDPTRPGYDTSNIASNPSYANVSKVITRDLGQVGLKEGWDVFSDDPGSFHKLEARYRHPALTVKLFAPMVHAKMVPLLRQIYPEGEISLPSDLTRSKEGGGGGGKDGRATTTKSLRKGKGLWTNKSKVGEGRGGTRLGLGLERISDEGRELDGEGRRYYPTNAAASHVTKGVRGHDHLFGLELDDVLKGIRLNAVEEDDLEYDPSLYQRERQAECDEDCDEHPSAQGEHRSTATIPIPKAECPNVSFPPPSAKSDLNRTTSQNAKGIYGNSDPRPDLSRDREPRFGIAHAPTTFFSISDASLNAHGVATRARLQNATGDPLERHGNHTQHQNNIPSTSTHSSMPWRRVVATDDTQRDLSTVETPGIDEEPPRPESAYGSRHLDPQGPPATYDRRHTQAPNYIRNSHSLLRVDGATSVPLERSSSRTRNSPRNTAPVDETILVATRRHLQNHRDRNDDHIPLHGEGLRAQADSNAANFKNSDRYGLGLGDSKQGQPKEGLGLAPSSATLAMNRSSNPRGWTPSHSRPGAPSNSNIQSKRSSLAEDQARLQVDPDGSSKGVGPRPGVGVGTDMGTDDMDARRGQAFGGHPELSGRLSETRHLARPRSQRLDGRRPRSRDQLR